MNRAHIRLVFSLFIAAFLVSNLQAIPTVTIDDTQGSITVSGSGFASFQTGTIDGNPEAIWWYGTSLTGDLGLGSKSGVWLEPGTSTISDKFTVVAALGVAYGIFLSDTTELPATFTIPDISIRVRLSDLQGEESTEAGSPTEISPVPNMLSVLAASSVPDAASTGWLLGLSLLCCCWRRRARSRSGVSA